MSQSGEQKTVRLLSRQGELDLQLPFSVGTIEGRAVLKEVDFIVWLSTNAPKPFSQVSVSLIVQNQAPHAPKAKPSAPPPSPEALTEALPLWFTPMEAVAWIVARHPRIVGYASPRRNEVRTFVIDHVLPNGKRVSGEGELPPGMSLLWLDVFAAFDPNATPPTDQALEELHAALRTGRIVARAVWVATGDRRDMGADEWHCLVLDTPPRNERVLLPYRVNTGTLANQLESRWREVLLPRAGLLTIWPMATEVQPAETNEATTAAQPEAAAVAVELTPEHSYLSRQVARTYPKRDQRRSWADAGELHALSCDRTTGVPG